MEGSGSGVGAQAQGLNAQSFRGRSNMRQPDDTVMKPDLPNVEHPEENGRADYEPPDTVSLLFS